MDNGKRQKVYACVRIVHDKKLEEKVTVEWWFNGEKKNRTKLDVGTKHAIKTVAFKSPGPGGVGEWEVRLVSEDKAVLARRKFTVVK